MDSVTAWRDLLFIALSVDVAILEIVQHCEGDLLPAMENSHIDTALTDGKAPRVGRGVELKKHLTVTVSPKTPPITVLTLRSVSVCAVVLRPNNI